MVTLANVCAQIHGKQAWGFIRTYGSGIVVEFGESIRRKNSSKNHGEIHLLVQNSPWRLLTEGSILIGSDDAAEDIDRIAKSLSLGMVEEFRIDKLTFDITIEFANMRFQSFTSSVGKYAEDCWILYSGEKGSWAVQPGPTLTFSEE